MFNFLYQQIKQLCTVHLTAPYILVNTIWSHFMTGLHSRIFGCKSKSHKTSTT